MSAATARPEGQSRAATRLATLLAVAVFINYVDRGNLATAAPVIKAELHLSATQIGVLIGAFYWTYAFSQIGAGWLAERFATYRVIAAGFALWSIATLLTGAASGFAMLLALRLLLGLGESVAFPCCCKLVAQHVSLEKRGRTNGAISVGLGAGPAFGTFVGGLILARFGWRPLFISLGALSLLWLWPWLTGPSRDLGRMPIPAAPTSGPSYADIVRRRAALGAGLAHFCGNYAFYFIVNWLPLYLVQDRGFSIARMAALGGAVYLTLAVGAYATGRIQDHWVRRGATTNRVYKTTMVIAQSTVALCLLGAVSAPPLVSAVCLLVAGATFGMGSTTLLGTAQTLAGPAATGRWMGFQNFVGNLAGITGPAITGFLVDRTGRFDSAFALAIGVALVGLLAWTVIVPRIAPLDWTRAPLASPEAVPVEA
jgi:MFS family permease